MIGMIFYKQLVWDHDVSPILYIPNDTVSICLYILSCEPPSQYKQNTSLPPCILMLQIMCHASFHSILPPDFRAHSLPMYPYGSAGKYLGKIAFSPECRFCLKSDSHSLGMCSTLILTHIPPDSDTFCGLPTRA